jgi:NADH:ubiquinone oxidoreductase subunit 6 (subunit J)
MILQEIILYVLVGTCVGSVLLMIVHKNLMYAALGLMGCLISLAGIFALLHAEFLAATQLLIYAGGVLVLIIFGIMLTNRIAGKPLLTATTHWFFGIALSAGVASVLIIFFHQTQFEHRIASQVSMNSQALGIELMSSYVAPFEVSGVLLLVCLVGAAFTASWFKKHPHE